jgi:hypothetical protein
MTLGLRVEVEVDLAGHPLVVEFGKKGREPVKIPPIRSNTDSGSGIMPSSLYGWHRQR